MEPDIPRTTDLTGDAPRLILDLPGDDEVEDLSEVPEITDDRSIVCDEDDELSWIIYEPGPKDSSLGPYLTIIRQLLKDHEWEKALPFIHQVLSQDPENPFGSLYHGIVLLSTNQISAALSPLSTASRSEKTAKTAIFFIALGLYRTGDYLQSRDHLQRLVTLDPENIRTRFLLGLCLVRLNQYSQAVHEFESVLAKSPDHDRALLLAGYCHIRMGNPHSAIGYLDHLLELDDTRSSPGSGNPVLCLMLAGIPNPSHPPADFFGLIPGTSRV
ncbi:MAG: tetratricopeptide repeat protein [Methanomicrobiales archaeon]|nr:tetratricopeptide repeat protein [Methanomicrobiales archaeon]